MYDREPESLTEDRTCMREWRQPEREDVDERGCRQESEREQERRKRGQVNVPPGPGDSEEEGSSKRGTRVDGDGHPPRAGRKEKGTKANSRHPAPVRDDQRRNSRW